MNFHPFHLTTLIMMMTMKRRMSHFLEFPIPNTPGCGILMATCWRILSSVLNSCAKVSGSVDLRGKFWGVLKFPHIPLFGFTIPQKKCSILCLRRRPRKFPKQPSILLKLQQSPQLIINIARGLLGYQKKVVTCQAIRLSDFQLELKCECDGKFNLNFSPSG